MFRFFLILTLLFLSSCNRSAFLKHGKLTLHNTADRKTFIFSIDEEFGRLYGDTKQDENHPKLNKAESSLLSGLLSQRKYCTTTFGSPKFTITSKQEKIYDTTFAHLIQENYNLPAVTPKTFFGQCAN